MLSNWTCYLQRPSLRTPVLRRVPQAERISGFCFHLKYGYKSELISCESGAQLAVRCRCHAVPRSFTSRVSEPENTSHPLHPKGQPLRSEEVAMTGACSHSVRKGKRMQCWNPTGARQSILRRVSGTAPGLVARLVGCHRRAF